VGLFSFSLEGNLYALVVGEGGRMPTGESLRTWGSLLVGRGKGKGERRT